MTHPVLREIVKRIEALPDQGEGMTVGAIADAVGTDTAMVVAALEEIVEREERSEGD